MTTSAKPRRGRKPENNAEIRVRIDAKTKDKAARFFKRHGITTGEGVRLLIDRAIRENDPWFAHNTSSHIPNAETEEALRDENLQAISLEELRKMILGDE